MDRVSILNAAERDNAEKFFKRVRGRNQNPPPDYGDDLQELDPQLKNRTARRFSVFAFGIRLARRHRRVCFEISMNIQNFHPPGYTTALGGCMISQGFPT
jgi:hypothetical protein